MRLKLKRNWRWQDHSKAAISIAQGGSKESKKRILAQSDPQIVLSGTYIVLFFNSYFKEVRLNLIEDKLELDDEFTPESPAEIPKDREEKTV